MSTTYQIESLLAARLFLSPQRFENKARCYNEIVRFFSQYLNP